MHNAIKKEVNRIAFDLGVAKAFSFVVVVSPQLRNHRKIDGKMGSNRTKKTIIFISLAFIVLKGLTGCTEIPAQEIAPSSVQPQPKIVSPATHHELKDFFAALGYDWKTIEHGVPPFILGTLPADLDRIPRITEKKRIFFLSLLPMVLMANDEIGRQREELIRLFQQHDAGIRIDSARRAWVAAVTEEYRMKGNPLTSIRIREKLLKRVDIVPPSMALAQAASESGYGTSRFARIGNNLFGEWTFIPGTGMVPEKRPAGESYEVRRFETLFDSVRSYMKNLNTHRAYRALRSQRANLRAAGLPLRGMDLARGLENYSTRGEAYVEDIRAIIRRNHLAFLSSATLRDTLALTPESEASNSSLLASLIAGSRTNSRRINP